MGDGGIFVKRHGSMNAGGQHSLKKTKIWFTKLKIWFTEQTYCLSNSDLEYKMMLSTRHIGGQN